MRPFRVVVEEAVFGSHEPGYVAQSLHAENVLCYSAEASQEALMIASGGRYQSEFQLSARRRSTAFAAK